MARGLVTEEPKFNMMFCHAQTETQKDENSERQTGMRKGGGGGEVAVFRIRIRIRYPYILGLSGPHLDALVTSTDTDEDPAPSLFS
jgi:hypothetical protein